MQCFRPVCRLSEGKSYNLLFVKHTHLWVFLQMDGTESALLMKLLSLIQCYCHHNRDNGLQYITRQKGTLRYLARFACASNMLYARTCKFTRDQIVNIGTIIIGCTCTLLLCRLHVNQDITQFNYNE